MASVFRAEIAPRRQISKPGFNAPGKVNLFENPEQHPDVGRRRFNEAGTRWKTSISSGRFSRRSSRRAYQRTGTARRRAVAAAPSPKLSACYSKPVLPVIHDPDMIRERAARLGAHDPMYQDTTPTKKQQYNQTPVRATVDSVIDAAKRWNGVNQGHP